MSLSWYEALLLAILYLYMIGATYYAMLKGKTNVSENTRIISSLLWPLFLLLAILFTPIVIAEREYDRKQDSDKNKVKGEEK